MSSSVLMGAEYGQSRLAVAPDSGRAGDGSPSLPSYRRANQGPGRQWHGACAGTQRGGGGPSPLAPSPVSTPPFSQGGQAGPSCGQGPGLFPSRPDALCFPPSLPQFLLIFRKAAAGELQEDSGLHVLARLSEIDVSTEGVKGAKSFFEAKVRHGRTHGA